MPPAASTNGTANGTVPSGRALLNVPSEGRRGLKRYGHIVNEEWLPELRGWQWHRVLRQMIEQDAIIGAGRATIVNLVRGVSVSVRPAEESSQAIEIAKRFESGLHDMEYSWESQLSEFLSFLWWGYGWFEKLYKQRNGDNRDRRYKSKYTDGKYAFRGWEIRAQETRTGWDWDADDQLIAMRQRVPNESGERVIARDKALHLVTESRKGNPEGVSLLRNAYRCFAPDTDLLTGRGWVPVGDVTTDDRVCTLEPESGRIEYQYPTDTWSYDYDGELIHAHGRHVDQLVTPNHRMWVRRPHRDRPEMVEADRCAKSVSFQATAPKWLGERLDTVRVGSTDVDGDTWLSFLGLWLAEGHSWTNGIRHEVGVVQKAGPKADEIRGLMARLPWNVYEQTAQRGLIRWTLSRREVYDHLAPLGKSLTKRIPRYALEASRQQIGLMLDWHYLGDGCEVGGVEGYPITRGIATGSTGMSDDLMEAAFKAGYRPTKRRVGECERFGGAVWMVVLGKPFPQMRAHWDRVAYTGPVHCVTTDNGIVYTRRNGKATWSGNSWYRKQHLENLEAVGAEKDMVGVPVGRLPSEYLASDAPPAKASIRAELEAQMRNLRLNEQSFFLLPSDVDENGNRIADISLMGSPGQRQFDIGSIIERENLAMALAMFVDVILVGHERIGTQALHTGKRSMLSASLKVFCDVIADEVNNEAWPDLMRLNGDPLELTPVIAFGEIEDVDLEVLGDFLMKCARAGVVLPVDDEKFTDHILRAAGLPTTGRSEG